MTITYAFFRGNRHYNNGRLSKVHAFRGITSYFPICLTTINLLGNDVIDITQKAIQENDLCKICKNLLLKEGIKWFLKPSTDFSNNRGDSREVDISRETTEKITYNLGDYILTMTLFDGEFSSAVLRDNKTQRVITIRSDVNLVKLFMLLYRGLDSLGILSDEVAESLNQFVFDNKNK